MGYFDEMKKILLKNFKKILTFSGITWYFWPFILLCIQYVVLIFKGITNDKLIGFIAQAINTLIPRIVDLFLNFKGEIFLFIMVFLVVWNVFWVENQLASNSN